YPSMGTGLVNPIPRFLLFSSHDDFVPTFEDVLKTIHVLEMNSGRTIVPILHTSVMQKLVIVKHLHEMARERKVFFHLWIVIVNAHCRLRWLCSELTSS